MCDRRSTQEHPAVTLTTPWSGEAVLIDEVLVPVVRMLWDRGVRTFHSCQGGMTEDDFSPGYIGYEPDDHDVLVDALACSGLTLLVYEAHLASFRWSTPATNVVRFMPPHVTATERDVTSWRRFMSREPGSVAADVLE